MDRTIIAPYRAEEKELSQILYNKLLGLALLHPPSEDLKKCLSDEMFVKPNQQAFFHVMHYLFRLIDQQEFKKRFYWPITDKKSESNFRTCTVEYLKYLNEKHQLNWTNIKSYLVVMPGGKKFIIFMLDFVHFIIQELIKQKEKQLNLETSQNHALVTEANLHKMCKKDALFKDMASAFLDSIDGINKLRKKKMEIMTQCLEELSETTDITLDQLTDDKILSEFEDNNETLFDQHFVHRTDKVIGMEKCVVELKECMDKFYSKEAGFKYDKQKLRLQLRKLRDDFAIDNVTDASLASDDGVTINTLIKTFNGVIETVHNEMAVINKRPRSGIMHTRILDIQKDLQEMEKEITEFLMVIKSRAKERQDTASHTPIRPGPQSVASGGITGFSKKTLEQTLLMKYVTTPQIKMGMSDGNLGPSRLSLHDSKTTGNITSTFSNFLAPSRTVRQTKLNSSALEQSATDLNSSVNRSKLLDPMQLLRSIRKDTSKVVVTPKANISSLGSKWRERQSLFRGREDEIQATPTIVIRTPTDSPRTHLIRGSTIKSLLFDQNQAISSTSTLVKRSFASSGSSTMIQSPMTPFGSNDRTRIARSELQLPEPSNTNTGVDNQSVSTPRPYAKKPFAVKKVQDASLFLANVSTSPSGRLEPLCTDEDANIPKIKLNDISLTGQNLSVNNSIVCEKSTNEYNTTNIEEKNANPADVAIGNVYWKNKEVVEEDLICNTSDSILKDATL